MKLLQATLYTGSASYTTTATTSSTAGGNGHGTSSSAGGGGAMVPTIDGATVTEHVVDVVAALATRARTLLLAPQTLLQDGGSGISTASASASLAIVDTPPLAALSRQISDITDPTTTTEDSQDDVMKVDVDSGTPALLPLEFELHEHTVRLLWQWSRDGSGTTRPLHHL